MHVSLDGYFCDPRGDMRFAHKPPADAEWQEFVAENATVGRILVFGRTTYDMMAAWWPTPAAAKAMPEVAAQTKLSIRKSYFMALYALRRQRRVPPQHRIACADHRDFRYSTRSAFCAAVRFRPNNVS
jgi:hypothetical protein